MTDPPPELSSVHAVSSDRVYTELSARLQATDDISFRLLGLVPLLSGGGVAGLVLGKDHVPDSLISCLSLFAAAITLAVFRWELRNIQTCDWLRSCLRDLEQQRVDTSFRSPRLREQERPPQSWGKTEAEKLLYTVTIAVWLVVPHLLPTEHPLVTGWYRPIVVLSAVISAATLWSLFALRRPARQTPGAPPNGRAVSKEEGR